MNTDHEEVKCVLFLLKLWKELEKAPRILTMLYMEITVFSRIETISIKRTSSLSQRFLASGLRKEALR